MHSVSPSPPLILEPLGGVVEAAGLGEHAGGLGGHVVHALVQDPQPGLPFLACLSQRDFIHHLARHPRGRESLPVPFVITTPGVLQG